MDEIKKLRLSIENVIFCLTGCLLIMGMKYYYSQADCDSLQWILGPTVWWVQLLSRIPFSYLPGTGYVNHSLRLLIAPSCSGVRFMTILFATLVFSFTPAIASTRTGMASDALRLPSRTFLKSGPFHSWSREICPRSQRICPWVKGFSWIAVSGALSWLLTVIVNGLRIITAIYLPIYLESAGLMSGILTQDRLHTLIGVVIYFIALLTIYRLVGWFVQKRRGPAHLPTLLRKCAPPVFWYFTFTLGLPLLNRAGRSGAGEFTEFALLVSGGCALILLPYVIILLLRKQK